MHTELPVAKIFAIGGLISSLRVLLNFLPKPIFAISVTFSNSTHQLIGLIGGTFGLLTGFSLLSGVEILYFGFKLLRRSLKLLWTEKIDG